MKLLRASLSPNLINFQYPISPSEAERSDAERGSQGRCWHVVGISRKLLRASPSQNLNNIQLECNRNLKETAQSQHKPESHQFSIKV